jgi:Legume lectin domain
MMSRRLLCAEFVVVVALQAVIASAQLCDETEVSQVLHSDITTSNGVFSGSIGLRGEARVTLQGVNLTSSAASSYGGLFFSSSTNFQGDGGFSTKFALQSSAGLGGGEAWEFIVASSSSLSIRPPPYAVGSPNYGVSGWSRMRALVVEFDADSSSGAAEQDVAGMGSHIAVYLSAVEQCKKAIPIAFSDGGLYYVWIDFVGFRRLLEIRVSQNGVNVRPKKPTVECAVDVWSVLDIKSSNHVGFEAYNPPGTSGAEHSLVQVITLTDAYRPYDTAGTCASYANCRRKTENSLCTSPTGDGTTCTIETCPPTYVWDIAGTNCCSFVEKASWRITGSTAGVTAGSTVPCALTRTTIIYPTASYNCL